MSLNLYDLTLNSTPYFARLGATIDGAQVTALAHPDNSPTTNWSTFGDTDNLLPIMDTQADDAFLVYDSATNTYNNVEQQIPIAQGFEFTSRQTNDLADELMFGLAGPVVAGAAVIAHNKPVLEILGWTKLVGHNTRKGAVHFTMNTYGALTLSNLPEMKNGKSFLPRWKFMKRPGGPTVITIGTV